MDVDTNRKNILIGLLDWLYEEFGQDLPAFVRAPIHLALCVAHKASPDQRKALRHATAADVEEAIRASQLAGEFAKTGTQQNAGILDAVRYIEKALTQGIDKLSDEMVELRILGWTNLQRSDDILGTVHDIHRQMRDSGELDRPFTLTPPRNIRPRNARFVGRESELDDLHNRLTGERNVGVTQQAGVHGMGGVGKTEVAFEYAWRRLDEYPGGVFGVSGDRDLLMPQLAELAVHLGLDEQDQPELTAQMVKQRLEAPPDSLLIIDNLDERDRLTTAAWRDWLPGGACRRIITTRQRHIPGVPEMMPIERLTREQGIELLAHHRPDAADQANRQAAGDVVDFFDGLAVGVNVVGVYMAINAAASWQTLRTSLEERGFAAINVIETAAGEEPNYHKRVEAIFEETLSQLPDPEQRALEYAALMPPDVVVRRWLWDLLDDDNDVELTTGLGYDRPAEAVVEPLIRRTLLHPVGDDAQLTSLHRLLRRHINDRLSADVELRQKLLDQIGDLAEGRGKNSHRAVTHKAIRWELSPLLALSERLRELGRISDAASLANWVHTPMRNLGRFEEDRVSLARFLDPSGDVVQGIPPDDEGTLHSNLAMTLQDLGDLQGARDQMERAIDIDQKHFEADHPTLAIRYSNLATILIDFGDLKGARDQMERAIEINERNFEADHPTLATSYSNLALILQDIGDLQGARTQLESAIAIEEKHFEADHPTLGTSYNNLAHIELEDGNKAAACRLWRKAYAIWTKHFDDDHPNVRIVAASLEMHCGGVAVAFISYAAADGNVARRLAQELERRGLRVSGMDRLITPGESWMRQLQAAIAESDLFLVLVSREAEKSEWVTHETAFAVSQAEQGRLRVIPVLIDRDAEVPFFLRHIQGLDFSNPERAQRQLDAMATALVSSDSAPRDRAAELDAQVKHLRASKEALGKDVAIQESRRATWSSTITASVIALAAVAASLAGLFSLFSDLTDSAIARWVLPFGVGVLASLAAVVISLWLRRRVGERDPSREQD